MKLDTSVKIVSLILSSCLAASSVVVWLTTIQINGKNNTESINEINGKVSGMVSDLNKIQTDIALIKQAVGVEKETAYQNSVK